jgi:hypothetical protein
MKRFVVSLAGSLVIILYHFSFVNADSAFNPTPPPPPPSRYPVSEFIVPALIAIVVVLLGVSLL